MGEAILSSRSYDGSEFSEGSGFRSPAGQCRIEVLSAFVGAGLGRRG